ncbi:MAG: serine/threonine-protein kinase [Actinomycetes bacterium]
MTSSAGRLIGQRYRLVEPLGRGGMGVVWLAHDDVLDRTVAVKEVVGTTGASEDVRERMVREARAAARLDHPGAVRIYDIVDDDASSSPPWIVMEVLTGRTLKDAVNADGPLPPARVAQIGLALVDVISAAHRAGILHRDIKPANVQLCDDGRVVLTDFGIAQVEGDSSITRTGDIVGSPAYMSPERARGLQLGPQSDLFSLGATLYAAVEGVPPFERETPIATLTAIVSDPPTPCRRAGPVGPVIDGLLAKDPAGRLTEDETRERLTAITSNASTSETAAWAPVTDDDGTRVLPAVTATRAPEEQRRVQPVPRRPQRWLGAALFLLLVVGVGAAIAVWLSSGKHPKANSPGGTTSSGDGPFSPGHNGIPADWKTHTAPAGWSVATPADWTTQTDNEFIRYKRPPSQGSAYIAVANQRGSDASAVLDAFATSFESGHPGYQQQSRTTTTFRNTPVPVLTATYQSEGADLEASFLAYPKGGQVYLLWWQTLTSGWDKAQDLRAMVLSTFHAST